MRTYYFDMRDGIPLRDRKGLELPNADSAIEHGKNLARQTRDDPRAGGRAFQIVVIDQSGADSPNWWSRDGRSWLSLRSARALFADGAPFAAQAHAEPHERPAQKMIPRP